MPIQTLAPQRLHDQIAEHLLQLISGGEYGPGDKLPPERELAEALGVSRGSLRQALVALDVAGVLDIRVSTGIFVSERAASIANRWPVPAIDEVPPLDIIRARQAIEGETAALAAAHATEDQIAEIRKAATTLERRDGRYDLRHPADRAFHLRIAEAGGNKALERLVQDLWEMQRGRLYQRLEDHFSTPIMRDLAIKDHQAVLDAITSRSPEAARGAMFRHLERVYTNLATSALSIDQE